MTVFTIWSLLAYTHAWQFYFSFWRAFPYSFPFWKEYGKCIYIYMVSLFTKNSPTFDICVPLDDIHSNMYEVITCGLICISLIISNIEHSFLCLLQISITFEKCPFWPSAYILFFNYVVCLFWYFFWSVYAFLTINPLSVIAIANIFLLFNRLSLNVYLCCCCAKAFY